jgi:hypothetical protein
MDVSSSCEPSNTHVLVNYKGQNFNVDKLNNTATDTISHDLSLTTGSDLASTNAGAFGHI